MTSPVDELIVATVVLLLLQIPPPTASVNDVVWVAQTVSIPCIGPGNVLTVTTAVEVHPVAGIM